MREICQTKVLFFLITAFTSLCFFFLPTKTEAYSNIVYDTSGTSTTKYDMTGLGPYTFQNFTLTATTSIYSITVKGGVNYGGPVWNVVFEKNGSTQSNCTVIIGGSQQNASSTGSSLYTRYPTTCVMYPNATYTVKFYIGNSSSSYYTYKNGSNQMYLILTNGPEDTSTRIIDFTPAQGATVGNTVNFTYHAYINPEDIGGVLDIKLKLFTVDQNILFASLFSPSEIMLFNGIATTSGHWYFSTSTILGDGNYRVEATIERAYLDGWFINIYSSINDDQVHTFIVNQGTWLGNLQQSIFNTMNTALSDRPATSTQVMYNTCAPLSSTFDIQDCMAVLFVPSKEGMTDVFNSVRSNVLSHKPWGYITRVFNIITSTSTAVSLPSWTAHVQTSASSSISLTFDPADMIAGAGSLLNSIRDPIYGKNTREIFEPFVQLFFAIGVIFTIVVDLMRMRSHKLNSPKNAQ